MSASKRILTVDTSVTMWEAGVLFAMLNHVNLRALRGTFGLELALNARPDLVIVGKPKDMTAFEFGFHLSRASLFQPLLVAWHERIESDRERWRYQAHLREVGYFAAVEKPVHFNTLRIWAEVACISENRV